MKSFRELKEEVLETTNAAGAGIVAGLPPDSPPGPRKKKYHCRREMFAGMDVFEVNQDTFLRCREAKGRYDRYVKHVGDDEVGQGIREYGLKNPGKGIIIKDSKHGTMMVLRNGKGKNKKW